MSYCISFYTNCKGVVATYPGSVSYTHLVSSVLFIPSCETKNVYGRHHIMTESKSQFSEFVK